MLWNIKAERQQYIFLVKWALLLLAITSSFYLKALFVNSLPCAIFSFPRKPFKHQVINTCLMLVLLANNIFQSFYRIPLSDRLSFAFCRQQKAPRGGELYLPLRQMTEASASCSSSSNKFFILLCFVHMVTSSLNCYQALPLSLIKPDRRLHLHLICIFRSSQQFI